MHKKDYLQRRFEEFGKVMALILTLKKDSDWEKFEQEIAEATKKFTSFELAQVETLDQESFAKEVLGHPGLLPDQKKILAGILFEQLSYYLEKGEQEKYANLKNRCKELYTHIRNNFTDNEFDLDVHYKLNFLEKIGG